MNNESPHNSQNEEKDMDVSPVSFDISRKIAFITISTKMNIFTLEIAKEITNFLQKVETDPKVKVIVFKTIGTRIFSAGWDLTLFQNNLSPQKIQDILEIGSALTQTIINCPKPTIAQIQGSVIGYGCILSMACDFRIVADREDLFFQLPELSLGIYPGTGATAAPLKTLGMIHTQEMLLTGNKISLKKMEKWGGITEIVTLENLDNFTKDYAKKIAKGDLNMIILLQKSLPILKEVANDHLLEIEKKVSYYYFNSVFKKDSRKLNEFLHDMMKE